MASGFSRSTISASPCPSISADRLNTSSAASSPARAACATVRAEISSAFQYAQGFPICRYRSPTISASWRMPPPEQKLSKEPSFPYPLGPKGASRQWPTSPALPLAPL